MNYTPTQRIFPKKEFKAAKKSLKKHTFLLLEISSPNSSNMEFQGFLKRDDS